jgi:hypothetical protein
MKRYSWAGIDENSQDTLHKSPPWIGFNLDSNGGTAGGTWSLVEKYGYKWRECKIASKGDGHVQRADGIINDDPWGSVGIQNIAGGKKGNTRVYRQVFMTDGSYRPNPGTNWNAVGFEFHSSYTAWPGNSGPVFNVLNYDQFKTWADFQKGHVGEEQPMFSDKWGIGDLYMLLVGGDYASNQINMENRIFLSKGQWENRIIELLIEIGWNDNAGQPGSYYNGRHAPADIANSGFSRILYRRAPIPASASAKPSFEDWILYNPTHSSGGVNFDWENGPIQGRHYSPTLGLGCGAYVKQPNYRGDNGGPIPSSVFYAEFEIADTYADYGVAIPSGGGDTTTPPVVEVPTRSVTQSIDPEVKGMVNWSAVAPTPFPDPVEFFVDGNLVWTEHISPFEAGGAPNAFDTTKFTDGPHTFSVKATWPDGTATATATVMVRNTETPAPIPPTPLTPIEMQIAAWQKFANTQPDGALKTLAMEQIAALEADPAQAKMRKA